MEKDKNSYGNIGGAFEEQLVPKFKPFRHQAGQTALDQWFLVQHESKGTLKEDEGRCGKGIWQPVCSKGDIHEISEK